MNIEGIEKYLIPMINNFSDIKRIIFSAHDFRADRRHDEQNRTRVFVKDYLINAGHEVRTCGSKPRQMDWMFAERI